MNPRVTLAVRSDSFAGVERYICDVAAGLDDRGWPVSVIGGDEASMTSQLPSSIDFIPAVTTWQTSRALSRVSGPGLVHAHMTAAELAAVLTRPRTRARVIATRHFARPRGSQPLVRFALRGVARQLDREVAISRFVAGASGGGAQVILNGTPSLARVDAHESRQVLVMQRLEREKDTGTALHAWAASGLGKDGWRLLIAGRGSQESHLRALASQLGLQGEVEFTGFVRSPQQLRATSAMLLATAPGEPYGLAVVEAMAAGLPVLVAKGGAHLETVADCGHYFSPGDSRSCADSLVRLAGDTAERHRLAGAGRRRHAEVLTIHAHLDQLERLYREVLA